MIRILDVIFSLIGLVLLFPLFLVLSIIICLESPGGPIYTQTRVGRNGRDFQLLKFRSMRPNSDKGSLLTIGDCDPRVTRVGFFIRKYKLDELPQLINVLLGDMSLVGPRPQVRKYVNMYTPEQMKVLSVRPGITDYASIKYVDESLVLKSFGAATNSEVDTLYMAHIVPDKIKCNMIYIENQTVLEYLKIIFLTVLKIIR